MEYLELTVTICRWWMGNIGVALIIWLLFLLRKNPIFFSRISAEYVQFILYDVQHTDKILTLQ